MDMYTLYAYVYICALRMYLKTPFWDWFQSFTSSRSQSRVFATQGILIACRIIYRKYEVECDILAVFFQHIPCLDIFIKSESEQKMKMKANMGNGSMFTIIHFEWDRKKPQKNIFEYFFFSHIII